MSRLATDTIKEIFGIVKKTEAEVNEIYDNSSLTKPIQNDIVQSKRTMAYEEIKEQLKKYKNLKED